MACATWGIRPPVRPADGIREEALRGPGVRVSATQGRPGRERGLGEGRSCGRLLVLRSRQEAGAGKTAGRVDEKKEPSSGKVLPEEGSVSGQRDSNPRPPAPKAGALTGLRYTPLLRPIRRTDPQRRCKYRGFFVNFKLRVVLSVCGRPPPAGYRESRPAGRRRVPGRRRATGR